MSVAQLRAMAEEGHGRLLQRGRAAHRLLYHDRGEPRGPFRTQVLGVGVTVESVNQTDDGQIVALCCRGQLRQTIPILELPLPTPPPDGAEWIETYRYWLR